MYKINPIDIHMKYIKPLIACLRPCIRVNIIVLFSIVYNTTTKKTKPSATAIDGKLFGCIKSLMTFIST